MSRGFTLPETLKVAILVRSAQRFLECANVIHPDWHAELIVGGELGLRRHELYIRGEDQVTTDQAARVAESLNRRAAGEPTQYILGSTEFYGLDFLCDARGLIPRPETEILVERALKYLQGHSKASVLDLGTGSGCIAVVIAKECLKVSVTASDVSEAALELARDNARAHGLDRRIEFIASDLFESITGSFHLITANLPYVARSEATSLMREVRDFEPEKALFGGDSGLDILRRAIKEAPAHLQPGGRMLLEIGYRQSAAVVDLIEEQGEFGQIRQIPDYQGHIRLISACKM